MTRFDPELDRKVRRAILRQDLFSFVWKTFATLHQGHNDKFVPTWHVQAICFELENLLSGENKRLVINIPPRHLKSISVAVAFVAYVLGHRPETKIIVASYGLDLACKHAEDCRRVMESDWYKQAFPKTRLSRRGNTVDEFRTTQGGGRKAVSLGGAVTGHGADYIIIDDLLKAQDAASDAELKRAQDFIEGTLLSRFNKPSEGRVVMIAQRLHELDPPGYLLDKGTYRHLNLPAIAEEDQAIPIGRGVVHHRKAGDALFPENMNLETLERLRKEMGAAAFNCQYQQNPVAPDGSPCGGSVSKSTTHPETAPTTSLSSRAGTPACPPIRAPTIPSAPPGVSQSQLASSRRVPRPARLPGSQTQGFQAMRRLGGRPRLDRRRGQRQAFAAGIPEKRLPPMSSHQAT